MTLVASTATTGRTFSVSLSQLVCTTYYDGTLGNRPGVVGGVFSTTGGGTESFSYQLGASSAIGVGTSATGKAGTFSARGTFSVENDTQYIQTLTGSETNTYFTKTEDVYGGWTPVKVGKITAKQCASYTGPYTRNFCRMNLNANPLRRRC